MSKLVSNIYIVDSQQVLTPLPYGATSANGLATMTTMDVGTMRVMSVIVMSQNTGARCVIALMSTENVILDYTLNIGGTGGVYTQRTNVDHFGYGVPMRGVFFPVLTACTACLVLE